jgi:hypothetical protein
MNSDRGAGIFLHRSLRLRVTLATALTFVGLGVMVCLVLPRAYAEQVRESLRERTLVLSRGVAHLMHDWESPAESADPASGMARLRRLAGLLDAEPDFDSVVLLGDDGSVVAQWPDGAPAWVPESTEGEGTIEGHDHFVAVAPVPGSRDVASVAVRTSTARMALDLENMRWLFAAIFSLTCVAFWVLSTYLTRGIVDPLEDIRRAAMSLADGEPHVRVPKSGDREIDELGRSLDELGAKRRESTVMSNPLTTYLRERSPLFEAREKEPRSPSA